LGFLSLWQNGDRMMTMAAAGERDSASADLPKTAQCQVTLAISRARVGEVLTATPPAQH
jgi:hypothetical protein